LEEQRYHALRFAIAAGVALAAGLWWRRRRPFRLAVEGDSMRPTLEPGDYLVAVRESRPGRGDLVVVEHPERPGFEMVKRVAGVPGDSVDGRVLFEHDYWILGDDPRHSTDSRELGPITVDRIRGVVRWRYWPLGRFGSVG
jgi:signal peptidase I